MNIRFAWGSKGIVRFLAKSRSCDHRSSPVSRATAVICRWEDLIYTRLPTKSSAKKGQFSPAPTV